MCVAIFKAYTKARIEVGTCLTVPQSESVKYNWDEFYEWNHDEFPSDMFPPKAT